MAARVAPEEPGPGAHANRQALRLNCAPLPWILEPEWSSRFFVLLWSAIGAARGRHGRIGRRRRRLRPL
jgi:hypothetical protein